MSKAQIHKIKTTSPASLVDEEMSIISSFYGLRGRDWRRKRQMLMEIEDSEGNRRIQVDVLQIELSNGEVVKISFDLTSVYGFVQD